MYSALAPVFLGLSRVTDVLVNNWTGGIPAALNLTVMSSLTPGTGSMHQANDHLPSVILLDGTASLLLWRAMGTGVLKQGRL